MRGRFIFLAVNRSSEIKKRLRRANMGRKCILKMFSVFGIDYKYLDDNSYKLSAGGTVTEEFELFPENEFDKYEVYVEARK